MEKGRSTIDLFGAGFTLLRLGAAPPDAAALVDGARTRGVPLSVVDIADPAVAEIYQRKVVLVWPDGYVAWREDEPPKDPMGVIDCVRGASPATDAGKVAA